MQPLTPPPRRFIHFILAMLGLVVTAWPSIWLARQIESFALSAVVTLLPVLPAVLVVRIMGQAVVEQDELEQRIMLESFTFSMSGTALVALAVGLLENAGLAQPNWSWLVVVISMLWFPGKWLAGRKYR